MNSVQRELVVDKDLSAVWAFVKDMGNWASQMPGYISHELLNGDDSVWTLHVNFGPFARPVVIDVHVTQWIAPPQVTFEVKGRSDPFRGSGAFQARETEAGTAISLQFGAEGAVVPDAAEAAVDFAGREYKTAPLAERDDLFHRRSFLTDRH